jgi:hypothetical protein
MKIKAFAVVEIDKRKKFYKSNPYREPYIYEANIKYNCSCGFGSAYTNALGIYPTELEATQGAYHDDLIVVPCTITLSLPKAIKK